jgi:hypothetical protein
MSLFGAPDIQKLKSKHDVGRLIKALKYTRNISIQDAAIEALGEIGDPQATQPLIDLLQTGHESTRKVIRALGRIGHPGAVPALVESLEAGNDRSSRDETIQALLCIGDDRASRPVLRQLQDDKHSGVQNVAAELIRDRKGPPDMGWASALYWISKSGWAECAALGSRVIPVLEMVIRDSSASEYCRNQTARVLGGMDSTGIGRLEDFLLDRAAHVRQSAVSALNGLGWEPDTREEQAAYLACTGNTRAFGRIRRDVILPILIRSMDWEYTDEQWYLKGWLATILLRPAMKADERVAARAQAVLEEHAGKCRSRLETLVRSPRPEGNRDNRPQSGEPGEFGEMTSLVHSAVSYRMEKKGGGIRTWNVYDLQPGTDAVRELCRIRSPVSSNVLAHISQMADPTVFSSSVEVEYDKDHPSGASVTHEALSFKQRRSLARAELRKRRNPEYDLSAYKKENCWRLPKNP